MIKMKKEYKFNKKCRAFIRGVLKQIFKDGWINDDDYELCMKELKNETM